MTGQNIVVRDFLIGPAQEPTEDSPYEIYKQVGGLSAGFSWLITDLDFGNNLYLTLVVKHTTKERISSLEVQKTEKKYHAPVYANPQFELLDVTS